MFVPMVFISVLRATIISFGDAGFGSWPNATELATVKAAIKQAPPIFCLILDIGSSLGAIEALFTLFSELNGTRFDAHQRCSTPSSFGRRGREPVEHQAGQHRD